MTAFFGVYDPGCGDCRPDIRVMQEALNYNSSDAQAFWEANGIALGQKTIFNTPQSFSETLPLHDSVNNLTIVGDLRLDNRSELYSKIGVDPKEYDGRGDGSLVILAYRKWGSSLCEYLQGSFAFVLWDGVHKKLICCTDHLATCNLLYFYNGKKFIFASTPNPILALDDVPSVINENKLLTIVSPNAKHLFWEESWFKNILLIQAATVLTVNERGIKKNIYWTPDVGKESSFKSEADFRDAFKATLLKAVGNNINSKFPVTALLSGGLDSSAIVSVAAEILQSQNKELQVFSSVLPDGADPAFTDERYYINQLKSFPNVNINYITAPGKGFFSDLEDFQTTIYTPNLIASHYLGRAFARGARHYGSRVLLDGGGGELSVSYHGAGCYAEFFRKLQWPGLWHELMCRRKMNGEPIWRSAFNDVIKPIFPKAVLKKIRTGYLDKEDTHFLQPGIADELKTTWELRKRELTEMNIWRVSSKHRVNQANMIRLTQAKAHGKADLGDVEVRHPLLDKDLLEFCLATPANFKVKNGYKRYMVRTGLNGLLPPEIQWRQSKGAFSPDYRARYNTQLPEVRSFLGDISASDPIRRIVDVDKLKLWISDENNSRISDSIARSIIPQSVYLIHFLRRFPEYQK
ncbi:MAG: asparagine synthase-related protein [Mucilaginibacter sp.]